MGWADEYIKKLQSGETVSFRPRGNSMSGRIESGQLVTLNPVTLWTEVSEGDIVLCRVSGRQYLHLVTAIKKQPKRTVYQISNNKGFVNGWASHAQVYGVVVDVT